MLLELYLKNNNSDLKSMHIQTKIPMTTIRDINKRELARWNISYFDAIAKTIGKNRLVVMKELEELNEIKDVINSMGKYNLENRRYIGNKSKLLNWISSIMDQYTKGESFMDVFAGTGVVTQSMLPKYKKLIINDFLFSNNIIYKAFFGNENYDIEKMKDYQAKYQKIETNSVDDNYFHDNFGGKFFSEKDAKIIGEIRTRIDRDEKLNERERAILIASLLYSSDKIANTVGHYDAYRKNTKIEDKFVFELINPINTLSKDIEIYRKDANQLVREVKADVAFIDPPYNSRQYSRFYHVLENIAKWEKPDLYGVAMKPAPENMSDYSRTSAPRVFDDLVTNIDAKYIVVTYNNTYTSKSNSSRNKITHEEIIKSLNKVGKTRSFEKPFQYFNAGKTNLVGHKEYVFITEVRK